MRESQDAHRERHFSASVMEFPCAPLLRAAPVRHRLARIRTIDRVSSPGQHFLEKTPTIDTRVVRLRPISLGYSEIKVCPNRTQEAVRYQCANNEYLADIQRKPGDHTVEVKYSLLAH